MIARVFRLVFSLLALISAVGTAPASAQSLPGGLKEGRHIAIRLIAESDTPRAGSKIDLAFAMTPKFTLMRLSSSC